MNLVDDCKQCRSNIYLYADDAKIYKSVETDDDVNSLQRVVSRIKEWCNSWLLKLNVNKCKVVSYNRKEIIDSNYFIREENMDYKLEKVSSIKDLGVIFDSRLNFRQHIQDKINKAYSMIGLIKRNFIHMDKHTFVMLYKSLVRTHIEYAVSVWCPYKKGDIEDIEKIQKRATKLISLKKLSYKDRLIKLKLPTLKYRRLRGDMIEVFKILHNYYDLDVAPKLVLNNTSFTRGNSLKLLNHTFRYDLRKYSFPARIVNVWNSLPNTVVQAASIDTFKNRLDRFWENQEFKYDYTADLIGAGSRSEFNMK